MNGNSKFIAKAEIELHMPQNDSTVRLKKKTTGASKLLKYIGPSFIVSVAYDP